MNSRYNRFLHLERSRGEQPKPQEQVGLQGQGRFEDVQGPAAEAPQQVEVPEAHLERFRRQAEEPLVLEDRSAEPARVFSRCVRCGAANGRFHRQCYHCGADLESPEQREHDLQQQQAEAREREAQEARAREYAERQQEQARVREELMEQLRAEVGGRMRGSASYDSVGLQMLQGAYGSRRRTNLAMALIFIPLILMCSRNPRLSMAVGAVGLFVAALFIPNRWWRKLFRLRR